MKKILFLGLVFVLAVILRFYRLGEIPVGFHRDEAFLGYNAYSILKTGKDMSGSFLPLHLESFLFSPAGYSYFSIPFIKLFGLNEFSVRFSSAFFGVLTVLATYFLVKELFSLNSKFHSSSLTSYLPLLASFLLAISPWHINLSRTATENILVVFFVSFGAWIYLLWLKKDNLWLLLLSFFLFGLTLFIYQASRAFLPFFIPLMIFIFLVKENRRRMLSSVVFYVLIILVPLLLILSSKDLSLRIRTVSIFATQQTQLVIDESLRQDGVSNTQNFVTRLFHNKPLGYFSQFLENYFKHFSYDFLFMDQGYPERYRIPLAGLIYPVEIPLLILGVIFIINSKNRAGLFLIGWIIVAPVGSALTFDDVPNLQRTLIIFPAISALSALGLLYLYSILKSKNIIIKAVLFILIVALTFEFFFYLHQYFVHGKLYRPWYRHDGYKDLVLKVNNLLPKYKRAVITNRESAPTIFFLFFSKYDPLSFQKETQKDKMRDFDRISFGKYSFSEKECPVSLTAERTFTEDKKSLFVNSDLCKTLSSNAHILEIIRRKDNSGVFQIIDIK